MADSRLPLSTRFFKLLLRLLPADFRWDYAHEMELVFSEQAQEAKQQRGLLAFCILWHETILGFLQTAPREHWEILKRDCGYALRNMRQNLGFTIVTVLTLALGIGSNTSIFSIVNGVLLHPLPYKDADQIIQLHQLAPRITKETVGFSVPEIGDYRTQNHSFSGIAEYHSMWFTLLGGKEPERVSTGIVSSNYFDVLGIKPVLGRNFLPSDETMTAAPVLLLSYSYWQQHLGEDPNILGRTFELNDKVHTVVGVLPPIPDYPDANDVYMPSTACPFRSAPAVVSNRSDHMLEAFARLKPGITAQQASADLQVIAHRLALQYPKNYPADIGFTASLIPIKEELTHGARPAFLILLATAALVLLLACANVANLALSRQIHRSRELAIRVALGAQRARIFRQLLTESTLTALLGGGFGLILAAASMKLLTAFASRLTPRTSDIRIDGTVLCFTLCISLLTGILFGSLPGLSASRTTAGVINEAANRSTTSRRKRRINELLVVSQVTISLVLLIGAGLLARSLYRLLSVDPGFKVQNVVTMQISLNWTKYKEDTAKLNLYRNILNRLSTNPAIRTAAVSMTFPLDSAMGSMDGSILVEGAPMRTGAARPHADFGVISDEYFSTLGISLLEGRIFRQSDDMQSQKVAIINEHMARHYWPEKDPVGRRISPNDGKDWLTIIGVVGNVHQYGLDHPIVDELYLPTTQNPLNSFSLLIRTGSHPMQAAQETIRAIHQIDPMQPVTRVKTMEQIKDISVAAPRIMTSLLTLFAVLALIITVTGITGVLSLLVSERNREIGIRMALGADRYAIFSMILRQGLAPIAIGLFIGSAAAFFFSRLLSGLLFEVKSSDPMTFFSVGLLLAGCATLACITPANRATRVEPMAIIRNE